MTTSITTNILIQLLQHNSEYISGAHLAERFNITRVSIWAHFEKLRKAGFTFEAIQNKGYRLISLPEHLHEDLLHAHLALLKCKHPVFFHNTIGSTNTEADQLLASNQKTPFLVIAKEQTAGRARLGRSWYSRSLDSLYMTFGFNPNLPNQLMQRFSLWMALNFCEFICKKTHLSAQIKWPNDILVNGKKISGMLAEAKIDADSTRNLILGISVNVNGNTAHWPKEIQSKASTLQKESKTHFPLNQFAAEFIQAGFNAYSAFIKDPTIPSFPERWKALDFLNQKTITAQTHSTSLTGKVLGIDDCGLLLLESSDTKTIHKLASADISLSSIYQHP